MSISGKLRHSACECLAHAREMTAQNQAVATRYACLELRQAIEYLAYQQLDAYLREVPDDAMRKWTPCEVMRTISRANRSVRERRKTHLS